MPQTAMIEPEVHDLIRTLTKQQIEVLSKGSILRREQKALGELKKQRDGTIAELMRLEVKLTNIELPLGLTTDERGYVVAEDTGSKVLDETEVE